MNGELLDRVRAERVRSDARYGPAQERGYTPHQWVAALVEEVGEVARTLNKEEGKGRLIEELIQVAGVAMAAVTALEGNE